MRTEIDFERQWPELSRRLRARFSRRRVPQWVADEAIQETGIRLFRYWGKVEDDRLPWGLTARIGDNCLWDELNRQRMDEPLDEAAVMALPYDVEAAAIARSELREVKDALPHLSGGEQAAILAELGVVRSESAPSVEKVLRMRARRRLEKLTERGAAVGVGVVVRWRNLTAKILQTRMPEPGDLAQMAGSAATALVGLMLTVESFAGIPVNDPSGVFDDTGRLTAFAAGAARDPVKQSETRPSPARRGLDPSGRSVASTGRTASSTDGSDGNNIPYVEEGRDRTVDMARRAKGGAGDGARSAKQRGSAAKDDVGSRAREAKQNAGDLVHETGDRLDP